MSPDSVALPQWRIRDDRFRTFGLTARHDRFARTATCSERGAA